MATRAVRKTLDGDLPALLEYWQQTLRLMDWDITLKVARYHEMEDLSYLGNVLIDTQNMNATVKVRDQQDEDPDCPEFLRDLEITLVHELVHVSQAAVLDDMRDVVKVANEQHTNRLARALVRLRRGGP